MLKLVRSNDRSDWEDDYALHRGAYRDEPPDDRRLAARRPKRRGAAGRVILTLVTALAIGASAVAIYLVARDGALDGILGRADLPPVDTPASPPPTAPAAQQSAATVSPVPDVPVLVLLIRNALVSLDQANVTGNYSVFRGVAGPGLQQATTAEGIAEAFTELRASNVNLGLAAVANPRLVAEPAIDEEGFLRLAGFMPLGAEQVNFEMSFQPVEGRWRLFGIGADSVPPPEGVPAVAPPTPAAGVMPDEASLVALVRGAILALNQANVTGDYAVLSALAAPGFRDANSAASLAASFANLRTRGIDLSPVAVIDPRLFRPAAIDGDGYLRVTGYFPSRPEQVNYDLAFEFIEGRWRLFGIGVNTSLEVSADTGSPASAAPATPPTATTEPQAIQAPPAPAAAGIATPPAPRLRPHS